VGKNKRKLPFRRLLRVRLALVHYCLLQDWSKERHVTGTLGALNVYKSLLLHIGCMHVIGLLKSCYPNNFLFTFNLALHYVL